MSDEDLLTLADLEVLWEDPNCAHERACLAAIASIGGDPATVGELVAALRRTLNFVAATEGELAIVLECGEMARAVLAKIPEAP